MSMIPKRWFPLCAALHVISAGGPALASVYYPRPELANPSVGLLETKVRGSWYRGSGTVARDPRLIYSCAHVVYDRGVWADDYVFHRAWHDRSFPRRGQGASPRGFHYLTAYARAARFTNGESNASFANDFTVFYGYDSFGPAVPVQESSASLLRGGGLKRILGYPADIDFTRGRGFAYQHSTGWFPNRGIQILGAFYDFRGVSTGSGNSGGGIFLPNNGTESLAGILVAGSTRTAGVVAMTRTTRRLADDALGSASEPWSSARTLSARLDGEARQSGIPINVDARGLLTGDLTLVTRFEGLAGDPPRMWLQSPAGRVQRVAPGSGSQLVDAFGGTEASGVWRLMVSPQGSGQGTLTGVVLSGSIDPTP